MLHVQQQNNNPANLPQSQGRWEGGGTGTGIKSRKVLQQPSQQERQDLNKNGGQGSSKPRTDISKAIQNGLLETTIRSIKVGFASWKSARPELTLQLSPVPSPRTVSGYTQARFQSQKPLHRTLQALIIYPFSKKPYSLGWVLEKSTLPISFGSPALINPSWQIKKLLEQWEAALCSLIQQEKECVFTLLPTMFQMC